MRWVVVVVYFCVFIYVLFDRLGIYKRAQAWQGYSQGRYSKAWKSQVGHALGGESHHHLSLSLSLSLGFVPHKLWAGFVAEFEQAGALDWNKEGNWREPVVGVGVSFSKAKLSWVGRECVFLCLFNDVCSVYPKSCALPRINSHAAPTTVLCCHHFLWLSIVV